jgi:hypothetical protein
MVDTFVALHAMHFCHTIIGRLTGFSAVYVSQVLVAAGKRERWHDADDARAALPREVLDAIDDLISIRAPRPAGSASNARAGLNLRAPLNAAERQAR